MALVGFGLDSLIEIGAVFVGISLNAAVGWRWAAPAAGLVIVYYAAREAQHTFTAPVHATIEDE